jgi:DNA topoisomerase-1
MYIQVATLYAVMRDTDYMQKQKFKENFWTDWRKMLGKNHVIQNLEDCDFTPIYDWSQIEKEKKKQMSSAVSCFMYFHLKMIEMNISKYQA